MTNLANLVIAEMKNKRHLTIGYTGGVTGGATTQDLVLSNVFGGRYAVGGVETLDITSQTADNKVTISASNAHTAINVSGDRALELDIDSFGGPALAIDASAWVASATTSPSPISARRL